MEKLGAGGAPLPVGEANLQEKNGELCSWCSLPETSSTCHFPLVWPKNVSVTNLCKFDVMQQEHDGYTINQSRQLTNPIVFIHRNGPLWTLWIQMSIDAVFPDSKRLYPRDETGSGQSLLYGLRKYIVPDWFLAAWKYWRNIGKRFHLNFFFKETYMTEI